MTTKEYTYLSNHTSYNLIDICSENGYCYDVFDDEDVEPSILTHSQLG